LTYYEVDEAEDIAGKMLGQILVTKQAEAEGKLVNKVYICQKLSLANEIYLAVTLDCVTVGFVVTRIYVKFLNLAGVKALA